MEVDEVKQEQEEGEFTIKNEIFKAENESSSCSTTGSIIKTEEFIVKIESGETSEANNQSAESGFTQCIHCGKAFKSEALDQHIIDEHSFKCEVCDKYYKRQECLNKHNFRFHKWNCELCGTFFRAKKALIEHNLVCNQPSSTQQDEAQNSLTKQCVHCEKSFDLEALKQHMIDDHSFKCEVCEKVFKRKDLLKRHKYQFHKYNCEKCEIFFTSKKALTRHNCFEPSTEDFQCKICNLKMTRKYSLQRHMLQHEMSWKCDKCGESCNSKDSLTRHKCFEESSEDFQCKVCDLKFTRKYSLQRHMLQHKTEWRCDKCRESFESKELLSQHIASTHSMDVKGSFECKFCHQFFGTNNSLDRHVTLHHDLKCDHCGDLFQSRRIYVYHLAEKHSIHEFKCHECDHIFTKKDALKRHRLKQHNLKCEICGERFEYRLQYTQHLTIEHSAQACTLKAGEPNTINITKKSRDKDFKQQAVQCEHCDESFETKVLWSDHMANVHALQSYLVCEFCNQSFCRKDVLARHLREQHMIKCDQCDEVLQSKKMFFEHMKDKHNTLKASFKCIICYINCSSEQALNKHNIQYHKLKCEHCSEFLKSDDLMIKHLTDVHSINSFFKCNTCSKMFGNQTLLNRHMRLHSFKCESCDKYFLFKNLYIRHMSEEHKDLDISSLKRIFKCDLCDKEYNSKVSLGKHITYTHRIKCKHCDEVFQFPKLLNKHMADQHSDFEHINCHVCEKVFNRTANLRRHYKFVHPEADPKIEYKCYCNEVFAHRLSLRRHIAKVHKKNSEDDENSGDTDDSCDSFEIGKFECDKCSAAFESFHELESHGKVHIKDENESSHSSNHKSFEEMEVDFESGVEQSGEVDLETKMEQSEEVDLETGIKERGEVELEESEEVELEAKKESGEVVIFSGAFECLVCKESFEAQCDLEKHSKVHIKME